MVAHIRRIAALLLAALLLHGVQPAAVQARETAAPDATSTRQARPALWVVKDRDTTIYLFGTIHILRPGIAWFESGVKKAFDASDELVLEIADQGDATAQAAILQTAMAADGPPLTAQLAAPARRQLLDMLEENGLSPAVIDRMKPWFAAVTLTALPLRKLGYDPKSGVEETLRTAADAAGKPIIGLETTAEQLGLFDSLSHDMQMALLTETLNEQSKLAETLASMIGAWSAGDPVALATTLNSSMDDDPELAQRLLLDRNQHWADWIAARLQRPGTVFLAVGAGHLAGTGSVQAALDERHIKTRRLKNR